MKFCGMVGHNPGTNRWDSEYRWPKIKVTRGQEVKITTKTKTQLIEFSI